MADPKKQLRTPIYPQNIVKGKALNVNASGLGKTQINAEIPTGPGIIATVIRVAVTLTVGTGTTPLSETTNPAGGLLNWLRQINMRTDNGEVLVDNQPGRSMYKWALIKGKTAPRFDAMAAANGTYRLDIPIFHSDPLVDRPNDTILVSARYRSMVIDLITGPLSDLLGTVGTASFTATVDVDVYRTKNDWDKAVGVLGYTQYSNLPVIDASNKTTIDLERASDLFAKRLMVHSTVNGVAGQPFAGTNSDAIIDYLNLKSSDDQFVKDLDWLMMQDDNKLLYSLETVLAGYGFIDFVRDGSNLSALYADRNMLQLSWANQAGVAATSNVTVGMEARRELRPPKADWPW